MIFKRILLEGLKDKYTLGLLIIPIVLIFAPPFTSDGLPFGLYIYGLINMYTAFLLAKQIAEDKEKGTIIRISISPFGYFKYLFQQLCGYFMLLLIQNIVFIIAFKLKWQTLDISYLQLSLLYMTFNLVTISFTITFSLLWNKVFKSLNMLSMTNFSGIGSVIALISGITIPMSYFPSWIDKIAMILPTYWLPYGLDGLNNKDFISVSIALGIMLVYSLVLMLIGSKRELN